MKLFQYLSGMLIIAMLIIAYVIFSAGVFSIVWLWLAVPIFKLQPISIYKAILLATAVNYLSNNYHQKLSKEESKRFLLLIFLKPFLLLVIAFVLKRFI